MSTSSTSNKRTRGDYCLCLLGGGLIIFIALISMIGLGFWLFMMINPTIFETKIPVQEVNCWLEGRITAWYLPLDQNCTALNQTNHWTKQECLETKQGGCLWLTRQYREIFTYPQAIEPPFPVYSWRVSQRLVDQTYLIEHQLVPLQQKEGPLREEIGLMLLAVVVFGVVFGAVIWLPLLLFCIAGLQTNLKRQLTEV